MGRKPSARVLLKMKSQVDLGQVRAFVSTKEDHRPACTPSPQRQGILVTSWVVLCARL